MEDDSVVHLSVPTIGDRSPFTSAATRARQSRRNPSFIARFGGVVWLVLVVVFSAGHFIRIHFDQNEAVKTIYVTTFDKNPSPQDQDKDTKPQIDPSPTITSPENEPPSPLPPAQSPGPSTSSSSTPTSSPAPSHSIPAIVLPAPSPVSTEPRKNCMAFRTTEGCLSTGVVNGALSCGTAVSPDFSGFCECEHGLVASDCLQHPAFNCEHVCKKNARQNHETSLEDPPRVCWGWRQTGRCDGVLGNREDKFDDSCSEWIAEVRSGYCECGYGVSLHFNCDHPPIMCIRACEELLIAQANYIAQYDRSFSLAKIQQIVAHNQETKTSPSTTSQTESTNQVQTTTPIHGQSPRCIGWRQTGDCDGRNGPREAQHDMNCEDEIASINSGFCECVNNTKVPFSCDHAIFTCNEVCEGPMASGVIAKGCSWFQQTSGCSYLGRVEHSVACDQPNLAAASGYCECKSGKVPGHNCGHSAFTCVEECQRLFESLHVIQRGYEEMLKHEVLLVAITRDKASVLPQTIKWVEQTGALFGGYHVLVLEEDSRDSTASVLQDWSHKNFRVEVETRKNVHVPSSNGRSPSRFERLAFLRNRYIDRLDEPKYSRVSFVIVFDSDLNLGWDLDGIAHSFGLLRTQEHASDALSRSPFVDWHSHVHTMASHWDAVCSNSIVTAENERYYDSLAYIDRVLALNNFRDHQAIIHHPLDPPRALYSCFGGITIYRKHAIQQCRYGVLDSENAWGCEHHGLHRCMLGKGLHLFINPRQVVHYRQVNK